MKKHNADKVRDLDMKIDYQDKKFNYILLPIYIASFKYNNKTFNFYINGYSGKIVGNYPKSKVKQLFIGIGIAILAIGVGIFLWQSGLLA